MEGERNNEEGEWKVMTARYYFTNLHTQAMQYKKGCKADSATTLYATDINSETGGNLLHFQ